MHRLRLAEWSETLLKFMIIAEDRVGKKDQLKPLTTAATDAFILWLLCLMKQWVPFDKVYSSSRANVRFLVNEWIIFEWDKQMQQTINQSQELSRKWVKAIFDMYSLFNVWEFSSHSRTFHTFGDITITGEGLKIMLILGTHGHWAVRVL